MLWRREMVRKVPGLPEHRVLPWLPSHVVSPPPPLRGLLVFSLYMIHPMFCVSGLSPTRMGEQTVSVLHPSKNMQQLRLKES